jgi:hypothetical protein
MKRARDIRCSAIILVVLSTLMALPVGSAGLAQTETWLRLLRQTDVAVTYYAPVRSSAPAMLKNTDTRENAFGIVKRYSDGRIDVTLALRKQETYISLSGEVLHAADGDLCFTLKVTIPFEGMRDVVWCHDPDSAVVVGAGTKVLSNCVEAKTTIPPAGAFNTNAAHDGGYGDKLGAGRMSFFPCAAITTEDAGLAWGIDMGLPVVYRLSYEPRRGIVSEFDLAVSAETKQFPNRAFFKMLFYEFNPRWRMRSALEKYYLLQPEFFEKRLTQEGIWLPFAPLCEIHGWEDFGFAFHETNAQSMDRGFQPPLSSFAAGKRAGVLTFQYTEPWEEEIAIDRLDLSYDDVMRPQAIPPQHAEYLRTSAALDKEGKYIARKLETPWMASGWSLSINTNTDPGIKGFNRCNYVYEREILPAMAMNADGIYFDCVEWHWHYDMNYNRLHFATTPYPLTFSASLEHPRPVVWGYATSYEFMRKVADDMHRQGKYVMGNTIYWLPFAAGVLDVFGSEVSMYIPEDTKMDRLQFARAIAHRKPVVYLLNEGLDDTTFTQSPYSGYRKYFDRMLFYGIFPSFFSVNATSNIYWADSSKYNQGRPFFKKYIPLIREISRAGWEPVTLAHSSNRNIRIERYGRAGAGAIYFTLYNDGNDDASTVVTLAADDLLLEGLVKVEDPLDGEAVQYKANGRVAELPLHMTASTARLLKVTATK